MRKLFLCAKFPNIIHVKTSSCIRHCEFIFPPPPPRDAADIFQTFKARILSNSDINFSYFRHHRVKSAYKYACCLDERRTFTACRHSNFSVAINKVFSITTRTSVIAATSRALAAVSARRASVPLPYTLTTTELLLCNVINVARASEQDASARVCEKDEGDKGGHAAAAAGGWRESGKCGPSGNNCPGTASAQKSFANIANDVNQSRAQLSRVFARRGQINFRFDTQPFGEG